ncbi:hypothetical protein EDB85DRAFT_1987902 [Lactarius pseudohatsudake]|nr:hypothetical protein EDB85DRAFT_1987902 [Lactarius pseudohatsudake]
MIAGIVVAATIVITSSCKDQAMPWCASRCVITTWECICAWTHEGVAGFYHSLATNLVRALPGTCVTFVVYGNIAWLLKHAAARCEAG